MWRNKQFGALGPHVEDFQPLLFQVIQLSHSELREVFLCLQISTVGETLGVLIPGQKKQHHVVADGGMACISAIKHSSGKVTMNQNKSPQWTSCRDDYCNCGPSRLSGSGTRSLLKIQILNRLNMRFPRPLLNYFWCHYFLHNIGHCNYFCCEIALMLKCLNGLGPKIIKLSAFQCPEVWGKYTEINKTDWEWTVAVTKLLVFAYLHSKHSYNQIYVNYTFILNLCIWLKKKNCLELRLHIVACIFPHWNTHSNFRTLAYVKIS